MIKIQNIEKSYNAEKVLKGISLEFNAGDFISVMGESGSGKSTLLSIMGGFLSPDTGSVLWEGRDVSTLSDKELSRYRCTKLGFVFQSYRLISTLNVWDNMLLPATLGGHLCKETVQYARTLVERLNLQDMLHKYPSQLSGGQCQRAAIIRALAYKPSAVILDEPTGALDSRMEETVMNLISEINKQDGTVVIQVTHSEKVASYARKTIKLCDGEVVL